MGPRDLRKVVAPKLVVKEAKIMKPYILESYWWQKVKSGLEDPSTHLSRIENAAGTGISDVSACRGGVESWLELKVAKSGVLHFRTSQRVWISKRLDAGGRVLVFVNDQGTAKLYNARGVLASPRKPAADGKSFTIKMADIKDPPLLAQASPIPWALFRERVFGPL